MDDDDAAAKKIIDQMDNIVDIRLVVHILKSLLVAKFAY